MSDAVAIPGERLIVTKDTLMGINFLVQSSKGHPVADSILLISRIWKRGCHTFQVGDQATIASCSHAPMHRLWRKPHECWSLLYSLCTPITLMPERRLIQKAYGLSQVQEKSGVEPGMEHRF